jgi:glutaconate CoA-transferase subunit A
MAGLDKRMSEDAVVSRLRDGMTIGVGGWATRRKPMSLIRAILRSDLKDLTLVAYGGPEVGMLAAAGKLKKLVFAFVSLDHYPLEPHFRAARQEGLEVLELDEGMFHWGLRAAAMRLPFLPTRIGVATDIARQSVFKTVTSPYDDGEELIAMPALKLDAALIHVHRADEKGNVLTLSPDPFFDELMARAADAVFVSAETVVTTQALGLPQTARYNIFERSLVSGVVEAPFGAHPTSASPDYPLDLDHLKTYVDSAASPQAWSAYRAQYVDVSAADYLAAVGGGERLRALPAVVY